MDPRKTWRCVYGHSMTDEEHARTGCQECIRELHISKYYKTLVLPGMFIVVRRQDIKDGYHHDIVGHVTTWDPVNDVISIGYSTILRNPIILNLGG